MYKYFYVWRYWSDLKEVPLLYFVMVVSFQNGTVSTSVTMWLEEQFVTTFVSMVIFRGYYRILGVIGAGIACYLLAYYTEYYKQFVEGRHFQQSDAALNWYGCVAGILCMVGSYFLNRLLVKLS